jgi:hypothetical protein
LDSFPLHLFRGIFRDVLNSIVVLFIRLLEMLFAVGAAGCVLAVIPMTAYRLFMVLFEPAAPDEERSLASDSHHLAAD